MRIATAIVAWAMVPFFLYFVPAADAQPVPVRSILVAGVDTGTYPTFSADIARYAITTDDQTAGTVSVAATTTDPHGQIWVDGAPATASTQVTGLSAGDEVSVIISDSSGRTPYSFIYLPAGFPKINVTADTGAEQPGLIAVTLNTYEANPQPAFDAIIDRNGVPVYAVRGAAEDLDLKQQPNGDITVARSTTAPGYTGVDIVTLDDQLAESSKRIHVQGTLTNTDPHDSQELPDGSTLLLGYEANPVTNKLDAAIQKLGPDGNPIFTWTSAGIADETAAGTNPDYAHINSIQQVSDGDVLVSFRHFSSVMRIATVAHDGYAAGDIIWKLGGRDSSFTFVNDPYGGPCAQHNATMLPNGHLLLFDNGTSGLCVDQSDPSGPTINRAQTRITEYALDTTNHTATLVWDYTPAGKYTLFAGSVGRLGNGDTLIGWAADRTALATEVDANKDVVWSASTGPALPGHQQYATYRAALIPEVPDKINPVVTPTGPGENATYVVGDSVAAGARCTDRGGSNLTECQTTGLVSGHLQTVTAGVHTWTAVGTDGAGNTTTVTRHYTVRAAVRAADGSVRRASSTTWMGGGIHGPSTNQTITQRIRRRHQATSYWKICNAGERSDLLQVRGTAGGPRMPVRYWIGSRDLTTAVVNGTLLTSALAPGKCVVVRVVTSVTSTAKSGSSRTFTLSAAPHSTTTPDRVAIKVFTLR
jgi:hypothetical protein